jgi:hypothetical protein
VYRSVERIEIPHVDFGGHEASTEPLDKVSGFSQIVRIRRRDRIVDAYGFADVDCDDVGTLLRQTQSMATALSACRSRDQGDLACNSTTHCDSPLS